MRSTGRLAGSLATGLENGRCPGHCASGQGSPAPFSVLLRPGRLRYGPLDAFFILRPSHRGPCALMAWRPLRECGLARVLARGLPLCLSLLLLAAPAAAQGGDLGVAVKATYLYKF